MRYSALFSALLMMIVTGVGCLNENPMGTDTANSESVPVAKNTVPFHARMTTTFTPIDLTNFPIGVFDISYEGTATHMGLISGTSPSRNQRRHSPSGREGSTRPARPTRQTPLCAS